MALDQDPRWQRLRDGDVLDELYRGNARKLLRYFAGRIPDPAEADDCVQEVFLRVVSAAAAEERQPVSRMEPWLWAIADNVRRSRTVAVLRSRDQARLLEDPTLAPALRAGVYHESFVAEHHGKRHAIADALEVIATHGNSRGGPCGGRLPGRGRSGPRHRADASVRPARGRGVGGAHPACAAADTAFALSFTGRHSLLGDPRLPYAAFLTGAGVSGPGDSWAAKPGTTTVTRTSLGRYTVRIPVGWLQSYTHLTGRGPGHCSLVVRNDYSRKDDTLFHVACFTPAGSLADNAFDLTYLTASPWE